MENFRYVPQLIHLYVIDTTRTIDDDMMKKLISESILVRQQPNHRHTCNRSSRAERNMRLILNHQRTSYGGDVFVLSNLRSIPPKLYLIPLSFLIIFKEMWDIVAEVLISLK